MRNGELSDLCQPEIDCAARLVEGEHHDFTLGGLMMEGRRRGVEGTEQLSFRFVRRRLVRRGGGEQTLDYVLRYDGLRTYVHNQFPIFTLRFTNTE